MGRTGDSNEHRFPHFPRTELTRLESMGKSAAKLIGIKKMMKRGTPSPASSAGPKTSASQKSRRADGEGAGSVSGDILDDNFLVETLAGGEGAAAALEGDSDESEGEGHTDPDSALKRRRHEELKEKKKARAGAAPRREDSAAVVSASPEAKAEFFLKHFRASDTGGRMSSVETADYVANEHFLGTEVLLDSISKQLLELCPACASGAAKAKHREGSVAAPVVAVLVGSSQVIASGWRSPA
jgi:hypothetical protein